MGQQRVKSPEGEAEGPLAKMEAPDKPGISAQEASLQRAISGTCLGPTVPFGIF